MRDIDLDQLPIASDYCDAETQNLDELHARGAFLGKTSAQAEVMFREMFHYYQEDLYYMRGKAFRFYVLAAVKYVLSNASDGDSDAVSAFCSVLEFRLQHGSPDIKPIASVLLAAVSEILSRFHRYEMKQEIYGDVPSRYRAVASQLQTLLM